MKLKHLFLTLIAGATALVSCDLLEEFGFNEEDLGLAELSVDLTELSLPKEESTATIGLVATRDWMVSGELPEWLTLSATSGEASKKPQTITVTVLENKGNDREATIGFTIGTKKVSVSVKQAGALGEYVVPTVTCAEFIKTDGQTEYIISGKVTSMNANYQYAYINDGTAEVEVYKPSNWAEFADKIKTGATLKAQGVYTLYTDKNGKNIHELVGVILEVKEKEPQTNVTTVTCAEFIQTDGVTEYIISGKVTSMNATYKYAYINDGTAEVEVYQPTNWSDYADKIKEGVTLKAQGVYTKYTNNTSGKTIDELVGVILSVEGEGNPPADETKAEPAGDGTEANPFNVSAAIDKAKEVGKTATEQDYYVKGKVSKITEQFGAQFGNGTFVLVDDGFTAEFTAYRILYFGGEKWVEGDATVAVGDELVAVGKIVNYNDKTPEITQGGHLYSLNGQTSIAQSDVFSVENANINVAASATSAEIKVKGNVAWTVGRAPENATVTPTSGEGAGTITVTFAANESTENNVVYQVVLTTQANVANQQIIVTITQSKANAAGEYEVQWLKEQLAAAADKSAVNQMDEAISFKNSSSYTGSVTELRIYKGQTLTVTAAAGYTIQEIEIGCTAAGTEKYGPGCFTASPETYSYNDIQGRWVGSASEVVFTAGTNQVRIVDLKIHYKAN